MERSAIFVDIENIFNTLAKVNRDMAIRLIMDPQRWIQALSRYDTSRQGKEIERVFAFRGVYYNELFANYIMRTFGGEEIDGRKVHFNAYNFTKIGFDDRRCKGYTTGQKDLADMHLCVDALTYIENNHRLESVFIISDDSGYAPLIKSIARKGIDVYVTSIDTSANGSSAPAYVEFARSLDVNILNISDFENLIDIPSVRIEEPAQAGANETIKEYYPWLRAGTDGASNDPDPLSPEDYAIVRLCLQEAADTSQGFLKFTKVGKMIADSDASSAKSDYWGFERLTDFIQHLARSSDWLEFDAERQGIRIRNMTLDISDWTGVADPKFTSFVRELIVLIDDPIPFCSPAQYQTIFAKFAETYDPENQTTQQMITKVSLELRRREISVSFPHLSQIFQAFNTYRSFVSENIDAAAFAGAWRIQMFEKARRPVWLQQQEGADMLAKWFSDSDEKPADAAAQFLQFCTNRETEGEEVALIDS